MGKKAKKKNKSKKTRRKKRQPYRPSQTKSLQTTRKKTSILALRAWQAIVVISVFCGLITFCFLLYPRIDVEIGQSLNPRNPFRNMVYLTNRGYFPIVEVSRLVTIKNTSSTRGNNIFKSNYHECVVAKKITPDNTVPIGIEKAVKVPDNYFTNYDIDIDIKFKLWPIPIEIKRNYKLSAKKNYIGELVLVFSSS